MTSRNPPANTQRYVEANRLRTLKRVERYYGKLALLQTWEESLLGRLGARAARFAASEHDGITRLTKTVRQERSYLEHRAGKDSDL